MSVITLIDLGTSPNDGTGDPLRIGGGEVNTNFTNLNVDKLERGGYAGTAQQLKDEIDAIQAGTVTLTGNNGFSGVNNFSALTFFSGGINVTSGQNATFNGTTLFTSGITLNNGLFDLTGTTNVVTSLGKTGRTVTLVIAGNTLNFEKGILVN